MPTEAARKITFQTPPPGSTAWRGEQARGSRTQPTVSAVGGSDGVEKDGFWATAPSIQQLSADPALFSSSALLQQMVSDGNGAADTATASPSFFLTSQGGGPASLTAPRCEYLDVDGPIDPDDTLIRYDVPFAPKDPRRSLRLRRKLGLTTSDPATGASTGAKDTLRVAEAVDPNVRVVLDSFLLPRRWVDAETGVEWVQHALPLPCTRTETMETRERLHAKLSQLGAKRTGTCPIRTVLVAECFLEVMRQVVTECWERGLLLLQIHAERVAAQAAHRELFESRMGHAMRLALKGEKDAMKAEADIAALKARVLALEQEEQQLRTLCDDFAVQAEESVLIEEKQHSEALNALKKEGLIKRNQLEQMLAVPPPQ